jgi:dihydrofolate synthase/folylpolyglutamate synthase
MQRLVSAMGDPQRTAPVVHVTGTSSKVDAQMATRLQMAQGLTVGTYTAPTWSASTSG